MPGADGDLVAVGRIGPAHGLRGEVIVAPYTDQLAAATVDGRALGPVRDVVHAPAADYLVIEVDGQERLVPFLAAMVPSVDVAGGKVVIDPPEGLLDL